MAKKLSRHTAIEIAVGRIQCGLDAMHEMATQHDNGISGATLSVCVEQMTLQMQGEVRKVLDGLDAGVRHG